MSYDTPVHRAWYAWKEDDRTWEIGSEVDATPVKQMVRDGLAVLIETAGYLDVISCGGGTYFVQPIGSPYVIAHPHDRFLEAGACSQCYASMVGPV